MPHFLNIPAALIAAAVAVPLLLLLYFLKLRRQEMLVSSTLLWKKSIQDLQVNAPFQRLRKNLLLFLQLLLLLLLILALSRPVVNYSPGAGKLAVILIDRSASMSARDIEGKTRLDEAKKRACELVDTLPKEGVAMVVAFDDSADIVRSFTSDRNMLKGAIESIRPTDRRTRLKLAFQLTEAKALAFYSDQGLRPNAADRPEIWLYSDGRTLDRDELALRNADLKYVRIGAEDAANNAIVALSAKRNYERPTDVQVFVRLANFGTRPSPAVLQLSIDGQVPSGGVRRDLLLLPERWTSEQRSAAEKKQVFQRDSAEFNFELMKGAVITVELKEQKGDVLAADDIAHVIVPPPRALNVLLVTKNGNLWLEKFLESANLKNPGIIAPGEYEDKMKDPQAVAAEYEVIIFDRYTPRSLPPAGNFIYFSAAPPDSKLKVAKDAQGVEVLLKKQMVVDWDRGHPMLRNLNLRFFVEEALKLNLPLEAKVLVDGRDGPLVVLHREARCTHLVMPFDVQNSSWPTSPTFPVFMDNALQFLALGAEMDVRQAYPPGATPRIPRFALQQISSALNEIAVSGPLDAKVSIPQAGDFALPALDRVGVYTLDPPVPQYEKLAVNLLDKDESNLLPVNDAPGGTGETIEMKVGKSQFELWRWLVAAAVPLCLLEWWVYTRRMHL